MKFCYLLFFIILLFTGKGFAQTTTTVQPVTVQAPTSAPGVPVITRPTEPLDIPEIDNYGTSCFAVYDQTNMLQTQLNAIEQKVLVNKLSENDVDNIEKQLTDFNTQLISSRTIALGLLTSGAAMNGVVYDKLKDNPLKIPGALIRVKNATKAVKVSLQTIHTMMTVTMVNIDHKLNIPVKTDTTGNHAIAGVANTGKTNKTVIKITGVSSLDVFNSLATKLAAISTVKSSEKEFNSAGTSVIKVVHYGSTDDLLAAMLANCSDTISSKNVTGSEKGKITLLFTAQ